MTWIAFHGLAAGALLLLGAALLLRAWRGRREGIHPHCARCEYDLWGLAPGAGNCPECGAELSAKRATRIGARRCRWRAAALAAICLVAAVSWIGLVAWIELGNVPVERHKPVWWLSSEARGQDQPMRTRALDELLRRLQAEGLSDAQVATLADHGLDHQADRAQPWEARWGKFIEAARAAKKVSDAQWQRYWAQASEFNVQVRPVVRRGDRIPVHVSHQSLRVASVMWTQAMSTALEPFDANANGEVKIGWWGGGGGSTFTTLAPSAEQWKSMNDGEQRVRVIMKSEVVDPGGMRHLSQAERKATFTLVPEHVKTVRLIPADKAQVEKAVLIHKVDRGSHRMRRHQGGTYYYSGLTTVSIDWDVQGLPVDMAFQIIFRRMSDGKEWNAGPGAWKAGSTVARLEMTTLPDLDAELVDIILRPDLQHAAETLDMTEIWDGELIVPGVPVVRMQSFNDR